MGDVVKIGDATLYHGDCREVLPGLPKFDAVISDPPFEGEAHTPMRRTQASIHNKTNDALDFDPLDEPMRNFIAAESARLCNGWILFFCQVEAAAAWRDALVSAGAKYRRTMVWVKPDSSPQFNGQGPAQGYECISAVWSGAGASRWNGGGRRGVFTFCCNTGRFGGHPTEKPVSLMCELVSLFSCKHASILDPFMGSGTTGVACAQMGRTFTGIERERKYFDIACERIERAYAQGKLFDDVRDAYEQTEQQELFLEGIKYGRASSDCDDGRL